MQASIINNVEGCRDGCAKNYMYSFKYKFQGKVNPFCRKNPYKCAVDMFPAHVERKTATLYFQCKHVELIKCICVHTCTLWELFMQV